MEIFGKICDAACDLCRSTVLGHKSPAAGFPHQNHDIEALITNEPRIFYRFVES